MKLTANTLKGSWATLLLPVNADESIDYNRLKEEIDCYLAARVDGIYSNGTAGELHNQTEEEFYRIQEVLSERCVAAGLPFQIGVSHPFPAVTLQRIKNTKILRPSAYQFILPDWVTVTQAERFSYIKKLATAAGDIPLVLYNPPHAKLVLQPHELKILCDEIPSLIGVKLATGNEEWYHKMQWSTGRFSVFVPGHFLASAVKKDIASGAYSNVACIHPLGAQRWWRLIQTNLDAALETERRIHLFFDECITPLKKEGFSNPALDKLLAAAGGWCNIGTRLREPYRWVNETAVPEIASRLKKYLPEFFET